MSVELLQGKTGDGKSFQAMVRVVNHLLEGGVVGLNFRLTEDWAYLFATIHPHVIDGTSSIQEVAESVYKRCFFIGDVSTLGSLCRYYNDRCIGPVAKRYERRVLVVIDEAQLYINAREWRKNRPWVDLFTQHRKMGLDLLLIAHHIRFVDAQARELIGTVSRSINFCENVRIPLIDIRFPWPFFIYVSKPHLSQGRGSWRFVRFNMTIAEMYDSHEVFAYDTLSSSVENQGIINDQLFFNGPCHNDKSSQLEVSPMLDGLWWCDFDPVFNSTYQ